MKRLHVEFYKNCLTNEELGAQIHKDEGYAFAER